MEAATPEMMLAADGNDALHTPILHILAYLLGYCQLCPESRDHVRILDDSSRSISPCLLRTVSRITQGANRGGAREQYASDHVTDLCWVRACI